MVPRFLNAGMFFIAAFFATSFAYAQGPSLRYATDRQLIDELNARFQDAGSYDNEDLIRQIYQRLNGGGEPEGARVSYNCNPRGNMNIAVVGPNGVETVRGVNMYDNSYCDPQAANLNRNRSRIDRDVTIAVCDSGYNLNRFQIYTDGRIQSLATLSVGERNRCLEQAAQINRR